MSIRKIRLAGAWIAGSLALQSLRAFAQDATQLAPVTVTGAAVTRIPQSDSSAVTILSGQEAQVGEISSIRDLSAQTPNFMVFDANDQRSPKFSFRGFRENNFGAGEPVVGFYVDDVPYYDMYSRELQLYDVRDMEFISGYQGTMYGASGVGGVVNINTRQPGNVTHGYLGLSYGDYNSQDYRFGLGGPLVQNNLFFGIDGLYGLRDGFVNNNFIHDHPDTRNTADGRATLRWTPTAKWRVTLTANGGRDNDGFVPTYLPGADASPFSVSRDINGYVDTYNTGEALKIGYHTDSFKITSVATHRDWRQDLFQDFDFSPVNAVDGFDYPRLEQWSEEFRIESPDAEEKLKWHAGVYYLNDDLHSDSGSMVFSPAPATTLLTLARSQNETYAAFAQGAYSMTEHWGLTLGVRLNYDRREILRVGAASGFVTGAYDSSDSFTSAQPKIAVTYRFTPKAEVYLSATEGYQSGGFNPSVDAAAQSEYSPERSWEFELGGKTSWFHDKLSANAALFYTQASDYQTYLINPATPTEAYLLNAERAELFGAELELTARPMKGLDISATAGYTDAKYNRFTVPAADTGTGAASNLDGKPISFVPEFTANLSARYRLPWWHLYVRGEGVGVGRYHLDDAYDITSGPTTQNLYILVNAQAGYETSHFNIHFFAKNIFDRHYFNNALNLGPSYGSLILQPGDPATFGVAATARF
ncbi:MAG TPA: TonB-dependent receptor [Verrucomicrobiae bacterium]|jgi:iron complex outermembrane receptor protein